MEEGLSRGLTIRAFARSADELQPTENLESVTGDALNEEAVSDSLGGCRAVIYALGINERLAMLWEEETLFSRSTRILIDAMEEKGVKRLVAVTGYGAGRSKETMSCIERTGHRAVLGKPYEDKDRQEEMILKSDLDWTIVRPVILINGRDTGEFQVLRNPENWHNGLISRSEVAEYLVDCVQQDLDVKSDVVLAR